MIARGNFKNKIKVARQVEFLLNNLGMVRAMFPGVLAGGGGMAAAIRPAVRVVRPCLVMAADAGAFQNWATGQADRGRFRFANGDPRRLAGLSPRLVDVEWLPGWSGNFGYDAAFLEALRERGFSTPFDPHHSSYE